MEINIFIDASHENDKPDQKSTTGFEIFVGDILYKFKSKRQKIVATSTFSAEIFVSTFCCR